MVKLVNQLRTETTELKRKFIEATKQYATTEFERINKLVGLDQYTLGNQEFGFELTTITNKWSGQTENRFADIWGVKFHNTKQARKLDRLQDLIWRVSNMGMDKFIAKQIDLAIAHYDNSIIKLADRILRKDLDLNNITMKTSVMDVNIETVITDGNKTVRAFTIIASGAVQKPHYRYLVK